MPARAWTGYQRFCPLSSALDVLGDRWTMVVLHELLARPHRYSDLKANLPGIGNNVLSDRLKRLSQAGLVEQVSGGPGEAILYRAAREAQELQPMFAEMRRWGVRRQLAAAAKGERIYDVSFSVTGDPDMSETFEWRIDDHVITLEIDGSELHQREGSEPNPSVVVHASGDFMDRWAAGEATWESGITAGDVHYTGEPEAWDRMIVATGYKASSSP